MVEIANVVGSGSLDVELDMAEVAADIDAPCVRYDPDNYHGVYLQYGENAPLITLYRTGTYNVSGADSFDELEDAKHRFLATAAEMGLVDDPVDDSFRVVNVVTTAERGTGLDLNAAAIGLGLEAVEYEPEQFPGLIYRPEDRECVVLLFANGKMVITGAREIAVAEAAYADVMTRLDEMGL